MFKKNIISSKTSSIPIVVGLFTSTWTSADGHIVLPLVSGETYDFDYRIDGGSWVNVTSDTHTITGLSTSGTRFLEIDSKNGGLPQFRFINAGDRSKIRSVEQISLNEWTNVDSMFYGCNNLTKVIGIFNFSSALSTRRMFKSCSFLTTLNSDSWNLSNITNMNDMFGSCISLVVLNISTWNVSSVVNIGNFVKSCTSLTTLNVSSWNVSSVTNISEMFRSCTSLTTLNISTWNVSSVTNAVNFMFSTSLTTLVYDAFLINADSLTVQSGVSWHFGSSKYTAGGLAETARTSLITNDLWSITDGGSV